MKNTKKLLLIFFLVFGFLFLSAGTANAAITDGLPADIGGFSNLTVFDFSASGNPYLITGHEWPDPQSFDGFRWNGTSWANSTVDSGLPNSIIDSSPAIFTMGGDWHLITGKDDGTFEGFKRFGGIGPWVASTIENGLAATGGTWSAPTIFPKDGFSTFPTGGKYLIAGKQDGTFDGYKFGAGGWVPSTIANSLPDVGWTSTITVFKMGVNWYAITGTGSGGGEGDLFPRFQGFKWSGGAWAKDTVIDNGLFSTGIVYHSAPEVFNIGTQYYLIFGERDGRFFGFHWNDTIKSWVEEVVDNTPPVVDSLTISDGEDTYTGGITTFNTLGNITINATAHDEVGGSGLSDFRIHWWYKSAPATVYSSLNGAGSGSASVTIDLSTSAGDSIRYWATASDIGGNAVKSPDWGSGWFINVKADMACPMAFFQYKNAVWSPAPKSAALTVGLAHTFIFLAKSGTSYKITKMESKTIMSTGNWRWLHSYKINSGADVEVEEGLNSGAATITSNCNFSTANNEKLKVKFSYGSPLAGSSWWYNQVVEGECVTCIANGGACGAPAECCSGNCQNGICCDNGHTCCSSSALHCDSSDICLNGCQLTDHYCDTVTDHYCKTKTTDCSLNTACAGGVCAGTNYCKTDHCIAASHEICNLQCDSAGGNCVMVASCEDHCINLAQDAVCGEEGIDCGGPCPNSCCTQTCFSNPGCLTDAMLNSSENTTLVCCGAEEECYECSAGFTWDVATSSCSPLCVWQDDGCGAHGCNVATHRGESCGPAGCSSGACNPAVIPTQCVPDASCCITDGNPYTGDPTVECCSGNGANGFCCAVGNICCNADAHCSASGCSGLCSIDDGTCDMVAHTCGTALADCPANTSCSGIACANTNYCDTGVCRNSGLHQICDKWCDGSGGCNNWTNCIDHCNDGIPNCGETETDCGGPNCDQCCHDLDSDTYDDCSSGDNDDGKPIDCCDSGLEGSIGCAMGTRAGINPGATEICENSIDEDCDGEDNPCCHWEDFGCGKLGCDIWTHRGEECLPDGCACPASGSCCLGETSPRCVADDLCSTFGLPDRTIMEILLDVVDWLLGIIATLAFLMIVIGGVVYLSSSGDPIRIETAKKIVTYAIIGLVVAGVSYAVIHVVFDVLQ